MNRSQESIPRTCVVVIVEQRETIECKTELEMSHTFPGDLTSADEAMYAPRGHRAYIV